MVWTERLLLKGGVARGLFEVSFLFEARHVFEVRCLF